MANLCKNTNPDANKKTMPTATEVFSDDLSSNIWETAEFLEMEDDCDEFSLLLDQLNAGSPPVAMNPATAELLATAAFLQREAAPVCPPPDILARTVASAAAGLEQAKTGKSRRWLYSGSLSTAAAVLLVIGLNLVPLTPDKAPSALPPVTAPLHEQAAAPTPNTAPPSLPSSPAPAGDRAAIAAPLPGASVEKSAAPSVAAPSAQATPPTSEVLPPTTPAAIPQSPPAESASEPARSAAVESEQPSLATKVPPMSEKAAVRQKSLLLFDLSHEKVLTRQSQQPIMAAKLSPLTLPGRLPDSITHDDEQGVIRQVYAQGTAAELTITQQRQTAETAEQFSSNELPAAAIDKANIGDPATLNTFTFYHDGQAITLSGHQAPAELAALAAQLTF